MYIVLLSMLLHAGGEQAAPGTPGAEREPVQTTCPADDKYVRIALEYGLTDPEVRARWGVGQVSAADLRVLTDDRDSALCQRFRTTITSIPEGATSVQWVYYQVGDFYIVTVHRTDGTFGLGSAAMWVIDSSLQNRGLWSL